MKKYILKRFLQLIPVLLGITFLSFAMMRVAGSDAITELYGDKGAVAQEVIDAKRAELGLDQPFLTQYFAWLGGLLTGDMGVSYVSGRNVFGTFVSKLPATLLLTALSIVATVLLSIPLGVLAAVRHDKFTDYFLRFFSFVGNALPNFFVALLLMQVFSIHWKLFPRHFQRHDAAKRCPADHDAGGCHVSKVYAAGSRDRSGRTEQGLCQGSQRKGHPAWRDSLEECIEIFDADDYYSDGSVHWQSVGRNRDH